MKARPVDRFNDNFVAYILSCLILYMLDKLKWDEDTAAEAIDHIETYLYSALSGDVNMADVIDQLKCDYNIDVDISLNHVKFKYNKDE